MNADQEEEVLSGITFRIFSSSDKDAEKARQIAEAVEALREEQQTEVAAANEEAAKELGLFIQKCEAELDELRESDPDSVEAKAEEHEAAILALMAEQKEAAKALADIHNEAVKALEEKLAEELEITDFSVLGEEYVTDEEGHIHKEDLLHENTYYIYETKTLPGLNLDTAIHEFTVDENGLVDGKDYYEIRIANVPNHVQISKKSITGMEELPGAELEIRSVDEDGNETVVENWISTEEPHLISALPAGNYTLTEITAPRGYAIAKTIAFAVTDSLEIQQVEMIDELLEIYISKKDITNDEELPGASLTITDSEGTVVEEWVSTEEPHMINLPVGEYVLTETAAPDGYLVASSIEFTVDANMAVQTVTMYDIPKADVYVSKKDVSTQEELPGAELSVTDEEGNEIDKWISEETPHYLKLKPGKYVLTEIAAPEEYQYAESVEFEIGEEDYKVVQTVTMYDAPIPDVLISKKDISGGEELPGAELTVTDEEGNVIAQWFSTTEPHKVKLKPGTYTLTELQAPVDYLLAESITFTVRSDDYKAEQTITMYDAKTPDVVISKKDITNEKELPGAELVIFRKNERPEEASTGDEIERWISTETPHAVKLLPGTYILRETIAPEKYATAEEIEFTVAEDGYKEVQTITMYDKPLTVSISKKDITNDEELPGAKLVVKDKDGKTVEEWISTKEPHEIVLEKGEYTLTEITAPQGYEVSETITFEVTDTMDVQHVTMYDSPKDELVDLTGKKKEETTTPGTQGTPGTDITTGPVKTGDLQYRSITDLYVHSMHRECQTA
ncbi:MAG: SpaA isopeptide-forming pilin-related protein [Eubacteriales bacterium]|nr:SpaA isopeptide-forming pilin-related protein [Eubacteriales bacterium]